MGGGDISYYVPQPKKWGGVMSPLFPPWVAPLVIWPVKIVPDMTYNVFGETLNLAQSITTPCAQHAISTSTAATRRAARAHFVMWRTSRVSNRTSWPWHRHSMSFSAFANNLHLVAMATHFLHICYGFDMSTYEWMNSFVGLFIILRYFRLKVHTKKK